MLSNYVEKSRLLVNLTVLLTLSLKHKHVVSKPCFPSVRRRANLIILPSGRLTRFGNVYTFGVRNIGGSIFIAMD